MAKRAERAEADGRKGRKGSPPSDSNKLHEEGEGSLAVGLGGVHGSQWEDSCPLGCLVALRGVLLEVLNHLVHLHCKLMPHFHDGILHTQTLLQTLGFLDPKLYPRPVASMLQQDTFLRSAWLSSRDTCWVH